MRERSRRPTGFRVVVAIVAAVSVVIGVWYALEGNVLAGIFCLAVALCVVALATQDAPGSGVRRAVPSILTQAYIFFGSGALVGVALVVLALFGVIAPLLGTLGFVCAAINGRNVIRLAQEGRRS